MQIIIDMDGTICSEERTFERALARIKDNAKESINQLYEQGHTIIIYSARSWAEYRMTEAWLTENGIKFHSLVLGKPIGDVWIDDRAMEFKNNWSDIITQLNSRKKPK